ncbi:uncharacterized protein LOC135440414 isoform X2 [Drosophila montana]|uniref:uncharacterized protein LOC135440414 isoform X2 n=1 Tax=Drosophila montana TaxID=40370 RepID=UPI00313D6072
MCHNSGIESEQIERYMAFGLPQKAVRSVKYTMRKREKQQRKERQQQQDQSQNNSDVEDFSNSGSSSSSSNSDSGTDVDIKPKRSVQQKLIETEMDTETIAVAEVTAAKTEEGASVTVLKNSKSDMFSIPKFCGRFRKMQEQQQEEQQQQPDAVNSPHSSPMTTVPATTTTTATTPAALTAQQQRKLSSMEPSMDDALAIGTQMTRKFAERCHCLIAQLHGTRLYTPFAVFLAAASHLRPMPADSVPQVFCAECNAEHQHADHLCQILSERVDNGGGCADGHTGTDRCHRGGGAFISGTAHASTDAREV